jgi:hypothetical protein
MQSENQSGEYYTLSLEEWELVTVARGSEKGQFPKVQKNGDVYVDKNRVGEEVRLFVRKQNKQNNTDKDNE